MKFHGRLAAVHEGGTMRVDADGLHVTGATAATLFSARRQALTTGSGRATPIAIRAKQPH
ncbi:hypothetical protein [Paenibacillus agaridevorans]|uniref:hypothetical protein n=1 Tax=Paenibacillus agaridevorans TaxID=171404 RepID=UPI001FEC82B3|nr:hypothetical protein [Paenibacillus agaridevorans]